MPREWLTYHEAAQRLGVGEATVRTLLATACSSRLPRRPTDHDGPGREPRLVVSAVTPVQEDQ